MSLRSVIKLAWIELKLFTREPITVVFALALPLVLLYILGSVFGNEPEVEIYRGVGAMDYYIPAYIALVVASVALISLPTHLAGYRERGVLKRFRASGVSAWMILVAEALVVLVVSAVGGLLVVAGAAPVYEFGSPESMVAVVIGFLAVALAFAAVGVLVGSVLPTARSAQAVGILTWFVILFLGGAGPPREVLGSVLQRIQDATPLWHAIRVMQDGWLSLDSGVSWPVIIGILVVASSLTVVVFRWE